MKHPVIKMQNEWALMAAALAVKCRWVRGERPKTGKGHGGSKVMEVENIGQSPDLEQYFDNSLCTTTEYQKMS